MVTIVNVHQRTSEKGNFMSLELNGDVELIQSAKSGNFYATAKRCFISSTFSETMAKSLIGSKLPGEIVREESKPYDYTVPETGEVVQLAHTYTYRPPQPQSAPEPVHIPVQHMAFS